MDNLQNIFNPAHRDEQNQQATIYVGNLDEEMTFELLWELFIQCGDVKKIHIPKDRTTGLAQGYAFVEFKRIEDAEYAGNVMNQVKLFGKPLRVNKAAHRDKQEQFDVGANVFIGGLSDLVDEKVLLDTFSIFGNIIQPPLIMRDPESGKSLGYGYLSFDNFTSSDNAVEEMHGQWLCGKQVRVLYKRKKGSKEKHGTKAERHLTLLNAEGNREFFEEIAAAKKRKLDWDRKHQAFDQ